VRRKLALNEEQQLFAAAADSFKVTLQRCPDLNQTSVARSSVLSVRHLGNYERRRRNRLKYAKDEALLGI
jgi:hypothetical protein